MYKSIIKKKKKKMDDKLVLLAKSQLNRLEVLTSKALIDSNISHDEFVLVKKCIEIILWYERKIKNFNNK